MGRIRTAKRKYDAAAPSRVIRPYSHFQENYCVNQAGAMVGCHHARSHGRFSDFDDEGISRLVDSRELYKVNDWYAELLISRQDHVANVCKSQITF